MEIDALLRDMEKLESAIATGPIVPQVTPPEIRSFLASRYDFAKPRALADADAEQAETHEAQRVVGYRYDESELVEGFGSLTTTSIISTQPWAISHVGSLNGTTTSAMGLSSPPLDTWGAVQYIATFLKKLGQISLALIHIVARQVIVK